MLNCWLPQLPVRMKKPECSWTQGCLVSLHCQLEGGLACDYLSRCVCPGHHPNRQLWSSPQFIFQQTFLVSDICRGQLDTFWSSSSPHSQHLLGPLEFLFSNTQKKSVLHQLNINMVFYNYMGPYIDSLCFCMTNTQVIRVFCCQKIQVV